MNMFQWNCDMYVPNTLFYGELRRFAMILAAELLMLISVAFIGSWYSDGCDQRVPVCKSE